MTSTPRPQDFRFVFEYCIWGALQPCRPVPLKTSTHVGAVDICDTGDWVSFHCGETGKEPERRIYLWWMGEEPGVYHEKIFRLPRQGWDNEWHHVVATCEHGGTRIWFDGKELEPVLQDRHFCKDVEFADFGRPENVAVKTIETGVRLRPESEPESTLGRVVEPRGRDETNEFRRLYLNEPCTLPAREGDANQFLTVDAGGALSWVHPGDLNGAKKLNDTGDVHRKEMIIAEALEKASGGIDSFAQALSEFAVRGLVGYQGATREPSMVEELPQGAVRCYINPRAVELVDISAVSEPDPLYRWRDDEVSVSELMMRDL